MNQKQLKYFHSSEKQAWETPQFLFDVLDAEFGFTLDVCATPDNAKCEQYFTPDDNGLLQSWNEQTVFCNPPYKDCEQWLKKAWEESKKGATVVCLVPARTDSVWFHKYAMKGEVRFFERRIPFCINGKPIPSKTNWCKYKVAPFPSILVIFRPLNYALTVQQLEIPQLFKDAAKEEYRAVYNKQNEADFEPAADILLN